jgi:hypothetical protein
MHSVNAVKEQTCRTSPCKTKCQVPDQIADFEAIGVVRGRVPNTLSRK